MGTQASHSTDYTGHSPRLCRLTTHPMKRCTCCATAGIVLTQHGCSTDSVIHSNGWQAPLDYATHLCECNECLIRRERRLLKALAPVNREARAGYLDPGVHALHQCQLPRGHLRQQHLHEVQTLSQKRIRRLSPCCRRQSPR